MKAKKKNVPQLFVHLIILPSVPFWSLNLDQRQNDLIPLPLICKDSPLLLFWLLGPSRETLVIGLAYPSLLLVALSP